MASWSRTCLKDRSFFLARINLALVALLTGLLPLSRLEPSFPVTWMKQGSLIFFKISS